jgi:hypothetical protein
MVLRPAGARLRVAVAGRRAGTGSAGPTAPIVGEFIMWRATGLSGVLVAAAAFHAAGIARAAEGAPPAPSAALAADAAAPTKAEEPKPAGEKPAAADAPAGAGAKAADEKPKATEQAKAADEKPAAPASQPQAEPPRQVWRPLCDGKTLDGWHKIGQGEWRIEDGVLVGRNSATSDFGHLVTDRTYKDFTVRLKYKSVKGNSGLYFRTKEEGFGGVSGFQAEIDPANDVGGLYETNGRGWVVQPKPADVAKWCKGPGEWNEMTVAARGGKIVVHVNGQKSAEVADDKGPWTDGHLALQVHGMQDCLVMFKDIEVLEEGERASARK